MRSIVCAIAVLVAAVSVSACGVPGVRELDSKNVKMTAQKEGIFPGMIEIKSPDELAKSKVFDDDASRDAIKKQIDFTKEKIVVVTWWGSSTSWVTVGFSKDGKKLMFDVVTGNPALADMRPHIHAFAVPKDAIVETPLDRFRDLFEDKVEITKLSLKGVKLDRDDNLLGRIEPLVIASADELAKSKVIADEASRDLLKKQIDVSKDKLVILAWSGSGGDKLIRSLSKGGKTATFTYIRGETDDLREHALAFAVPKYSEVKVVTGKE